MKKMNPTEAWENAAQLIKVYFENDNPQGYALLMKIHNEKKEDMLHFPAAIKQHHCYHGGYIVHVNEVMMAMDSLLNNGFSMGVVDGGRAMIAAYLHDFDKLGRYEDLPFEEPTEKQLETCKKCEIAIEKGDSKRNVSIKMSNHFEGTSKPLEFFRYAQRDGFNSDETAKVQQMLVPFGLALPDEVLHAITMHHGGFAVHANEFYMNMSPMATLLHMADMTSSKICDRA